MCSSDLGLRNIEAALGEVAKLELQRDTAIAFFESLRRRGVSLDMPFAEKRKILSLLVDRIFVNSVEKWYRLEGTIRGTFSYNEDTSGETERQYAISLAVTESVESISTL